MQLLHIREEVAEVMFARPLNCLPPAVLSWLSDNFVVYLKGQVCLCFQRLERLDEL